MPSLAPCLGAAAFERILCNAVNGKTFTENSACQSAAAALRLRMRKPRRGNAHCPQGSGKNRRALEAAE